MTVDLLDRSSTSKTSNFFFFVVVVVNLQERRSLIEPKKSNGAFQPFCKEDRLVKAAVPVTMAANSTADNEEKVAKEGQVGRRKSRRCWSPELHKRFIHALDQLGGSHGMCCMFLSSIETL